MAVYLSKMGATMVGPKLGIATSIYQDQDLYAEDAEDCVAKFTSLVRARD